MLGHLKLISESETEAYSPAADCYISIREDGTIIIKKSSGQESYQCQLWQPEDKMIKRYKARGQLHST